VRLILNVILRDKMRNVVIRECLQTESRKDLRNCEERVERMTH
jgi:hypothetical protein